MPQDLTSTPNPLCPYQAPSRPFLQPHSPAPAPANAPQTTSSRTPKPYFLSHRELHRRPARGPAAAPHKVHVVGRAPPARLGRGAHHHGALGVRLGVQRAAGQRAKQACRAQGRGYRCRGCEGADAPVGQVGKWRWALRVLGAVWTAGGGAAGWGAQQACSQGGAPLDAAAYCSCASESQRKLYRAWWEPAELLPLSAGTHPLHYSSIPFPHSRAPCTPLLTVIATGPEARHHGVAPQEQVIACTAAEGNSRILVLHHTWCEVADGRQRQEEPHPYAVGTARCACIKCWRRVVAGGGW